MLIVVVIITIVIVVVVEVIIADPVREAKETDDDVRWQWKDVSLRVRSIPFE